MKRNKEGDVQIAKKNFKRDCLTRLRLFINGMVGWVLITSCFFTFFFSSLLSLEALLANFFHSVFENLAGNSSGMVSAKSLDNHKRLI
jgi:hypothetical protein